MLEKPLQKCKNCLKIHFNAITLHRYLEDTAIPIIRNQILLNENLSISIVSTGKLIWLLRYETYLLEKLLKSAQNCNDTF